MTVGLPNKLNKKVSSCDITLTPIDNKRLMNLCGKFDEHIRLIEQSYNVEINNRGHDFQILGKHDLVVKTHQLLNKLYKQTINSDILTPAKVNLLIQSDLTDNNETTSLKAKHGSVKPLTANQKQYIERINKNDLNFAIGPAGTGKTYLAVACAINALEKHQVERIILVRPAVEAGERLGFLPGDLAQKIDPYLRPIYDALYEMMGFEKVTKLIERHVIEIAPLAYMRGRTLNDSFIILDESQNTTPEQMKMFLTRIGFGSKVVVNGDITQVDLPNRAPSGLKQVLKFLKNTPEISFTFFDNKDVVRHPLVQKIIQAYELFENNKSEESD
jgi:phosphate starvation-inducible PhoH-like protein